MLENTQTIDNQTLPEWNPYFSRRPWRHLTEDREKAYWKLKASSAYYCRKPEVRNYIFKRDGYKCLHCQSSENLTIDHIVSFNSWLFDNTIDWRMINNEYNLQTLCLSCNSSKK